MSDAFVDLIDRALAFFDDLRANNTKAWYDAHKDVYISEIKRPAELLAEVLRDEIGRKVGAEMKAKVFRIHRDVRFSKDKTPYNTHLHMMWTNVAADGAPVWFFGASSDYLSTGFGWPEQKGEALIRYRALVDRAGDDISDAIATARQTTGATFSTWGAAPLKRVPKPYAPDHPHADLLKRKSLMLSADLPDGWREAGLVPSLTARVEGFLPLYEVLNTG